MLDVRQQAELLASHLGRTAHYSLLADTWVVEWQDGPWSCVARVYESFNGAGVKVQFGAHRLDTLDIKGGVGYGEDAIEALNNLRC